MKLWIWAKTRVHGVLGGWHRSHCTGKVHGAFQAKLAVLLSGWRLDILQAEHFPALGKLTVAEPLWWAQSTMAATKMTLIC